MYLYRHKYWLISYQHLLCIYRNAVQLAGCWHHQSIAHIGSIQALLLAVIADPARALRAWVAFAIWLLLLLLLLFIL